jgi:hypothetical protein
MEKRVKGEDASEDTRKSETFGQLQTNFSGSGRTLEPSGVFRFKTFEEFNDWEERYYPKRDLKA